MQMSRQGETALEIPYLKRAKARVRRGRCSVKTKDYDFEAVGIIKQAGEASTQTIKKFRCQTVDDDGTSALGKWQQRVDAGRVGVLWHGPSEPFGAIWGHLEPFGALGACRSPLGALLLDVPIEGLGMHPRRVTGHGPQLAKALHSGTSLVHTPESEQAPPPSTITTSHLSLSQRFSHGSEAAHFQRPFHSLASPLPSPPHREPRS